MNAWKTIALATATVALAAPVANAKFDSSMPSKALHAKVAHHKRVAPKVTAKQTAPRVLIIVTPYTASAPMSGADECTVYATGCSDQQLCDLWGMNCDLVAVSPTTDAATEEQTATP